MDNRHIIVDRGDWCKIRSLIYDDNGKYQPEVAGVEIYVEKTHVWFYMPEGQPLLDLMKEEEIPFQRR